MCSILAAAGACSSDSPPADNHDAQTSDVSPDGEDPRDAVPPDAAEADLSVRDAVVTDATRTDVSSDAAPVDASVDAPLPDRTSSDVSSTDVTSGDAVLSDAPSSDASPADAPFSDASPADAPSSDSKPADASGDGGNDPSCPPSYGAARGQCSTNLFCVYPQGNCECIYACGPPPPPDAGNHWQCGTREASCPMHKPAVGTPCSMDAQFCNYGACCADWMKCENSLWKLGGGQCPP